MFSIGDTIRAFGQKRDIEGLQNYIGNLSLNELLPLIETELNNAFFNFTWNYILQGFTNKPDCHNYRFEVVLKIIRELEKGTVSDNNSNAIIHRLCMELVKFKSAHLVKLCDYCIECLQNQRNAQIWKELLPELLNVVEERQCIEYNQVEMSGSEYKHQLINSLCMLQWSPSIVTSLTSMFIDVSLTKDEHLQVVNKLGQYLEKMTPQEVPSFTYQLLRLCKSAHSRLIFLKLQYYFGIRVYDNLANQGDSNSESPDFDLIENANEKDAIEAESTILFHIHSSASLGHECIKDYLSSLKNMLKSPEFILHPFQLSVLLTISTISHYEEKVFETIKSCISRTYHEEQKKQTSAWVRDIIPATNKIESVFIQIINLSVENRELVLQGLVNLAFLLLGVGSLLGRDLIAEKQWNLGNLILLKIVKRKRHIAPIILQQLSNRIITGQNVSQYIECMYMLSKNLTLLMLENKSSVILLMEGLVQMPGMNAKQLLDALIPLTKVSPTIRDHFILLLRKSLYSRVIETRQMAVGGFVKLLSHLKIADMNALSQSSSSSGSFSSGHSLFTQISINRTTQSTPSAFSNEALSLEILSILRRCFMQSADVRIQLYEGVHNVISLNPDLSVAVLEMIWLHFCDFYNIDEDILPPLKFQKITLIKDVNVILQEPLGKLIYTISLIVTKVAATDRENETVTKFITILESLCIRMAKCELIHFELDDGTDLLDIVPESQQKLLILKQALCVYESLIGYKFSSWDLETENNGKDINSLFQAHSRLLQFSRNLSKPKKTEAKKNKKFTNNSTIQQSTNGTAVSRKDEKLMKTFKLPDTVLDFQVIVKILSLLYEPIVTWTSMQQANIVKSKREIHKHMMLATFSIISSLKNRKIIDVQQAKTIFYNLCDISILLYEKIVKKINEFIDYDCGTTILALDCFLLIINIVNNQFKSNFEIYLQKVGKQDGIESNLSEFIETYQKLFEIDEEETSEDPDIKKLKPVTLNTLHFFMTQIPTSSTKLSTQMLEWLKNYAVNETITNKNIVLLFANLWFDCLLKFKPNSNLLKFSAVQIGNATETISELELDKGVEDIKLINQDTATNILISLSNCVKIMLDDVEWIIGRLRAEFNIITFPGSISVERRRENLKAKEKGVCCQLWFIVTILIYLSNCKVPAGNLSEAVLKNLSQCYCSLSLLTKYFTTRSSKVNPAFKDARFERLAKLAGKDLAHAVYKLITYIEQSQNNDGATQSNKKKNVDCTTLKNKVLRETRLIPKVVFEIEQFGKFLIQLSKKSQIDLSSCIGQGTVRDFRLNLEKVLGQAEDTQTTMESDEEVVESGSEEVTPPPSKKLKQ